VLEAQFTKLLGRLKFDDEVLEWVRDALHASHADERREHEEATRRHQYEYKRLQDRINAMYVDKLDGLVDAAFFEKMSNQWREEQNRCLGEIEWHQQADRSYMDEGVQLLELARNAQRLFAKQAPREKRRLLSFLLSNCTWDDGEVIATFRQPFDLLAGTAVKAACAGTVPRGPGRTPQVRRRLCVGLRARSVRRAPSNLLGPPIAPMAHSRPQVDWSRPRVAARASASVSSASPSSSSITSVRRSSQAMQDRIARAAKDYTHRSRSILEYEHGGTAAFQRRRSRRH